MYLDLTAMLKGDVTRLRYVIRYSTCQRLHSENVAEHSYYVALYTMFIADWCNAQEYDNDDLPHIDVGLALRYALMHDLEEAITGDLPRSFKYSLPEIASVLHSGAEMAIDRLCSEVFPGMESEYVNDWDLSKSEESYEGRIVRFADYLAVLSYMVCELTNNKTMRNNWKTMHDYAATFTTPAYDFIRALVNNADAILVEAFRDMTK